IKGVQTPQYEGPRAKEAVRFVKNYHLTKDITIGNMVERSLGNDLKRWTASQDDPRDKDHYTVTVEFHRGVILRGKLYDDSFEWAVDMAHKEINPFDMEECIKKFCNDEHEAETLRTPLRQGN
ncbi:MAG: hypothetical protein ABSG42_08910, partial [Nitrospirota bacterium]